MALLGHTFVGDGLYCEHWNEGAPQGDPATTGVIAFRSQCGYPRGRHVALPPPIEPVRPETIGYLTESEIRAIDLAAEVWNLMAAEVVEAGSARRGDMAELAHHVHAIQQMIMSNAAARAYPSRFRRLGSGILGGKAPNADLA